MPFPCFVINYKKACSSSRQRTLWLLRPNETSHLLHLSPAPLGKTGSYLKDNPHKKISFSLLRLLIKRAANPKSRGTAPESPPFLSSPEPGSPGAELERFPGAVTAPCHTARQPGQVPHQTQALKPRGRAQLSLGHARTGLGTTVEPAPVSPER